MVMIVPEANESVGWYIFIEVIAAVLLHKPTAALTQPSVRLALVKNVLYVEVFE